MDLTSFITPAAIGAIGGVLGGLLGSFLLFWNNNVSRVYRINDVLLKEPEQLRPLRIAFCTHLGQGGWEMFSYSPQLSGDREPDRSPIIFERPSHAV